jgi:hypothetical protein
MAHTQIPDIFNKNNNPYGLNTGIETPGERNAD